jgi:hypothetical protein
MYFITLDSFKEIYAFEKELTILLLDHLGMRKDTFGKNNHGFFNRDLDTEEDTKNVKVRFVITFAESGHKFNEIVFEELKKFVLVHFKRPVFVIRAFGLN